MHNTRETLNKSTHYARRQMQAEFTKTSEDSFMATKFSLGVNRDSTLWPVILFNITLVTSD
jgi:hypothetical protein